MSRSISVPPEDERKLEISRLVSESSNTEDFIHNKKTYECKVIKINPKYLVLRLTNTRTKNYHEQYIYDNDLAPDFFNIERESNDEVQKAEQEILLNQNLQELEEAYESKGGQDEAILIFPNGRIVNGNTRTSLMRRLGYEVIKCVVLEDEELKNKEIELEAEEDEVPSGKIDFDKFSIGASINELQMDGLSISEIKKKKRKKSDREVQVLAKMYELGKNALTLRGFPGNWKELEKSAQIYEDLASACIKEKDPVKANSLSSAVLMIDAASSDVIPGRKYDHVKDTITHINKVDIFLKEIFGEKEIEDDFDDDEVETIFDEDNFEDIFSTQDE